MDRGERQADRLGVPKAAIDGMGADEIRRLLGEFTGADWPPSHPIARPDLRRPRLADRQIFRVRVDLRGAKPPIWRRLDVRSDISLEDLHRILQVAFDWSNSHLWRFSLGGGPFARTSQLFLCEWDIEEGELDDEGGVPAAVTRLDETLQDPGDTLAYAYDYGDGWELMLRLEDVTPGSAAHPSAEAVAGRRAAPPEDCGGVTDGGGLAEIVTDVNAFDLDGVNRALRNPFFVLIERGVDRRLVGLLDRLAYGPLGEELMGLGARLFAEASPPIGPELGEWLKPVMWFLDRAGDGGIPLTSAGYLKPADVITVAQMLPTMGDWIGKANRESDSGPVLYFREQLQSLGLLRKYKGTLRRTRIADQAGRTPDGLWNLLADRLVPEGSGFETDATLLLLLHVATSAGEEIALEAIADGLTELGWRTSDGQAVAGHDIYWLPAAVLLRNVGGEQPGRFGRWRISDGAARLAVAALHRQECSA